MTLTAEDRKRLRCVAIQLGSDVDLLDRVGLLEVVFRRGFERGLQHRPAELPGSDRRGRRASDNLAEMEREAILRVYRDSGRIVAEAAQRLGITPRSLYRRLVELQGARSAREEHAPA